MPRLELLDFDTKLFEYGVGRIDLSDKEITAPCVTGNNVEINGLLQEGHKLGLKLIYLFSPISYKPTIVDESRVYSFPGLMVDRKTTLAMPLLSFNRSALVQKAFINPHVRLQLHPKSDSPSEALCLLAVASGQWSRFRVDSNISNQVFEGMFGAWLKNSINQSFADATFVAIDIETEEEIGFITLKRKDLTVSIGLLAVSASHRRKGIASMLLSRGALWALEQNGLNTKGVYSVVTQGSNEIALNCYKSFGFELSLIQDIYHIWLPQYLEEPRMRADQSFIPFCKQFITGNELKYVSQVLSTGLDSSSRFTSICNLKIKEILGSDCLRALVVPSGTAALEMTALLMDLVPGDEVIMPSYTFASTANAFVLRGAVPVFVDIRADTLNIDEQLIEQAVTGKTKAIVAVHYAGVPCEMDTICQIAAKYNLYVVEDSAQGFMSKYKGRQLGTIGHFGCFSFHYTKNVICGEGGAISINSKAPNAAELVRRSLVLWEKGTNRYDFLSGKIDKYEWIDIGSSYVPSEVSCAILWAQLEKSCNITNARLTNFKLYHEGLRKLYDDNHFIIPSVPTDCEHNAHIFYIILPDRDQKDYYEIGLKKKGISTFGHYVPLHSTAAGLKFGRFVGAMTVTNKVASSLLRLPMWVGLSKDNIEYVIDTVKNLTFDRI